MEVSRKVILIVGEILEHPHLRDSFSSLRLMSLWVSEVAEPKTPDFPSCYSSYTVFPHFPIQAREGETTDVQMDW